MKRLIVQFCLIGLVAAWMLAGCFNPKKYDDIKPDGLISFTTKDETVAADGSITAIISVAISHDAAAGKRSVIFKTSSGSFKGGTADSIKVDAGSDFTCSAKLVSLKAGAATVSAKITNIQAVAQ